MATDPTAAGTRSRAGPVAARRARLRRGVRQRAQSAAPPRRARLPAASGCWRRAASCSTPCSTPRSRAPTARSPSCRASPGTWAAGCAACTATPPMPSSSSCWPHLLREWLFGRYHGFRRFSWLTGVPLLLFAFVSAIGGFWLNWDRLGQFSAIATAEWLDALPFFASPLTRNFLGVASCRRPAVLAVRVHPHRRAAAAGVRPVVPHPAPQPRRGVPAARARRRRRRWRCWRWRWRCRWRARARPTSRSVPRTARARLVAAVRPPADVRQLGRRAVAAGRRDAAAAVRAALAAAAGGARRWPGSTRPTATAAGAASTTARMPRSRWCRTRTEGSARQLAQVDADLCASCGICVGSCPSSTPFRSAAELVTGIDMPQMPLNGLRRAAGAPARRAAGRRPDRRLRLRPRRAAWRRWPAPTWRA